jgi:aldose 1-epimerase
MGLGSFPLVPFSGRIANGRFSFGGKSVRLPPNHPTDPAHPHPLHGFGWLDSWDVIDVDAQSCRMRLRRAAGDWPWPFEAEQRFKLVETGFVYGLSIENTGLAAMPAGLGLHPHFPRRGARLSLEVDGVWETRGDGVPTTWRPLKAPPRWFSGATIDNAFSGAFASIAIDWPGHRLTIAPDPAFNVVVVYAPAGDDFFCVEPTSHVPDAFNRPDEPSTHSFRILDPGESWSTMSVFRVKAKAESR